MRDVGFWDIGELQAASYTLGIGHPPGFATLILGGWLFTHVVTVGDVAIRANLYGATMVAAAATLVFATARRLGCAPAAALFASSAFALQPIVWEHAVRLDGVDVTLAFVMLVVALLVRAETGGGQRERDGAAIALGSCAGLHPVAIFVVPFVVVLLVGRTRTTLARAARLLGIACCTAGALLAYYPLRSVWVTTHVVDRVRDLVGDARPIYDYGHPATLAHLRDLLSGSTVEGTSGFRAAYGNPHAPLDLLRFCIDLVAAAPVLALLGACGLAMLGRRAPRIALGLAVAVLAMGPFYYEFRAESDMARYLAFPFALLAIAAAVAVDAVRRAVPSRMAGLAVAGTVVATVAICTVAIVAESARFAEASGTLGRHYIADIVRETPPNAIVVAPWVWGTPLAYEQYVGTAFAKRAAIVVGAVADERERLGAWSCEAPLYAVSVDAPPTPGVRWRYVSWLRLAADERTDAKLWRAVGSCSKGGG